MRALAGGLGLWSCASMATPVGNTGVFGWGANNVGQLGHNTTSAYLVPATTELYGKTIVAMASGDSHSLALDSNGVLYSWGSNSDGQLGNNSTTSSAVPVVVNTASGVSALYGKTVIAISAGIKYSVALASDGTVATWGADEGWGKLGNGSSSAGSVPTPVTSSGALAGKTIIAISAGQDHCLALGSDGIVYGWGSNHHGRLGSSVLSTTSTPVAVTASGVLAGKTIIGITAGGAHSLARVSDGTIYGWGLSYNGQLGNGSNVVQSVTPVAVTMTGALAGKTITALAAGREHTLALASDGTIYAWGMGAGGRLGNNSGADSLVPVAVTMSGVLAGKTVTAIAGGVSHSLALTSDGSVYAWGTNSHPAIGALGDGTSTNRLVPIAVNTNSGTSALAGATVLRLATSVVSPFSLVTASSTLGVPDAPVITSANALDGQVTVSFDAPASTGGATITGYAVTASSGGGTVTGTTSPITITGLTNGVAYTFTATATNSVGTSVASAATGPVTPPIPYAFTTLAGSGTAGSADATGTAAQFNLPRGVALDNAGVLYIADTSNHAIRKITSGGVVSTFAGSGSAGSTDASGTAASLNSPVGVTVSSDGTVYVADSANHKIRKITSGGVVTTLAGSGTSGSVDATGTAASFNTPTGVAVDSSGNVYVADSLNHKIRKITMTGDVTTYAGSGYASSWDGMSALTAAFNTPTGIAIDASGNVYIADAGNHAIRKITTGNLVVTLAGSPWSPGTIDATGGSATFNSPVGVTLDSAGNLYITDRNNHRIRKVTSAGVVSTLAGSVSGSADGTGSAAKFNNPAGIAVDSAGVLFVSDYNNQTIRRGTLYGASLLTSATTASGNVGASFSYQISFSNTTSNYTATGLPGGLSVDPNTGIISGTPTAVGTFSVTLGATNATGSLSLNIGVGSQSINFGPLANKTYGDVAFPVSATANSTLTPTYSIVSGPATITGDTLTLTGVGTVVVRASQAGNGSYGAAVPVDQNFSVAKKTLTVTASSHTRAYGTANPAFTVSYSGFAPGESVAALTSVPVASTTATIASSAGAYPVAVTGGLASNYSINPVDGILTITAVNQTISFPAIPDQAFGSAPLTLNATAISGLAVTYSIVSGPATISGATLRLTGVGVVVARASQLGDASFTAAAPVDRSFTVAKAIATVSLEGLTQTYNGSARSVTANTLPGGLPLTFTYDGRPDAPSGAGRYAVTATISDPNYTGSASGTLNISQTPQTVAFAAVPNHLANDAPFNVSATASSGLPVTFTVINGPAVVTAGTVSLTGATGPVTIRASQAGNAQFAPAISVDRSFAVTAFPEEKSVPVIGQQPANQTVRVGETARFAVIATGVPSPRYQWRRGGVVLAGEAGSSLSVGPVVIADSGAVFDVIVSNSEGAATSIAATLTISANATQEQVFFGPLGIDGSFALHLRSDGEGALIGELPGGQGAYLVKFKMDANGKFRAAASAPSPTRNAMANEVPRAMSASTVSTPIFTGSVVNGTLSGYVDGIGEAFNGVAQPPGSTSAFAGFYEAPVVNGGEGITYLIVGTDGRAMGATFNGSTTEVALGSMSSAGQFNVQIDSSTMLEGSVQGGGITGRLMTAGSPPASIAGISVNVTHTDRLVNISTRGTAGDDEKTIMAGFVIDGAQSKNVLIRAVGPALAALGVGGAMENPVLTLFRGSQAMLTNDDWSSSIDAALLVSESARLGAFPLAAGGRDAALLATLEPGAYTAQITGVPGSANGVALIELYDASVNAGAEAQKLINISSRGEVQPGERILISGFAVTGNFPKKVLIRGIGPSLSRQGVAGALADPILRLFRGSTAIAVNDDWTADNAAALTSAAMQVGAFALENSSKDAAILITLEPGNYTAQVSGSDGASGIALLEVYDVP